MKKNWVLRLGLLAMVLTLVTMPMVSSTYAKYVTEATGTDTARVAKWGVTITADSAGDGMFDLTYVKDDATFTLGPNSVISTENVVAPGTSGSYTFTLAGIPEVAVRVSFGASSIKDNWLVSTKAYEPLNWTIYNGTNYWTGSAWGAKTYFTLADLESELSSLTVDYIANASIATTYTIGWEWPFEWSSTYLAWSEVEVAKANVAMYYTAPATLATNPYNPATTYYSDSAATVVVPHSTIKLAAYDKADTDLGDLFLTDDAPSLTLNLRITATQIN